MKTTSSISNTFHPNHASNSLSTGLGSTSTLITDMFGDPYQFFLNLPFGESMAEQRRSGSFNNPYKFNGKELDAETSLYYYGARYYNPRISTFISVDPLAEHTMTPYQYTYQNPVRYIDPTGMAAEDPQGDPPTKSGNYINHNAQSIRIYRNIYFESDEDYQANKNALEQWNSFSGKSTYITDDKLEYSLYLNLNPVILKNGKSFGDAQLNDPKGLSIRELNETDFLKTALEWDTEVKSVGGIGLSHDSQKGKNNAGITRYSTGEIIQRFLMATDNSRAHELGHGLGLGHSGGVMTAVMDQGMTKVQQSNYNDVFKNVIKKMSVHPKRNELNSPMNNGTWIVTGTYRGRGNFLNKGSHRKIKNR